jgi:hypothetical protein
MRLEWRGDNSAYSGLHPESRPSLCSRILQDQEQHWANLGNPLIYVHFLQLGAHGSNVCPTRFVSAELESLCRKTSSAHQPTSLRCHSRRHPVFAVLAAGFQSTAVPRSGHRTMPDLHPFGGRMSRHFGRSVRAQHQLSILCRASSSRAFFLKAAVSILRPS